MPVSEAAEEVSRILSWKYANEASTQVAAKTSITALKKNDASPPSPVIGHDDSSLDQEKERQSAEGWDEPPVNAASSFRLRRPQFMSARSLSPAERGTAFHLVMQHLPMTDGIDENTITEMLDSLVAKRILSGEQRQGVDAAAIAVFCRTPIYDRMRASARVWREVPFTYGIAADKVYPGVSGLPAEETVIIQGVIDCLFAEDDGLVLVDYKTDVLKGLAGEEAAEKHRFQVEQYCGAVSAILGRPVKEAYVYFFDGGQTVRLV
ncbi:PD-(D/E)XK nuclease family protein [Cohnella kolymensis]|uniref:PD-(D/E)XK nuclease family protein n=1 Tax=Cohnella kolymensis TaxID=1590652 RepID=UPI002E118CD5